MSVWGSLRSLASVAADGRAPRTFEASLRTWHKGRSRGSRGGFSGLGGNNFSGDNDGGDDDSYYSYDDNGGDR